MVDCDEPLAHIGTYLEWLQDERSPVPRCALSSSVLTRPEDALRLRDLRLYSLEALERYVATLSSGTENNEGPLLPTGTTIVPPTSDTTRLAQRIRSRLATAPWAQKALHTHTSHPQHAQHSQQSQEERHEAPVPAEVRAARRVAETSGATTIAMPSGQAQAGSTLSGDTSRRARCSAPSRQRVLLVLAIVGTLLVVLYLALSLEAPGLLPLPLLSPSAFFRE